MLNYIWGGMIILGVLIGGIRGSLEMSLVANSALDSAKEAVELCIVMLGVVGMWNGVMNIAVKAGLIERWTKKLKPAISFLFPAIPENHPSRGYIATNMIANIFGLGWAATPAGLKAMEELSKLEDERNTGRDCSGKTRIASNEMCTFLVINISSLQLIPMNIIAYRSQYGSTNPTGIIGPAIIATLVSTLTAIIICRLCSHGSKRDKASRG